MTLTFTVPMKEGQSSILLGLSERTTLATTKIAGRALVLEVVTASGQSLSQSILEDHGINPHLVLPWVIGRLQGILLRNGWEHYASGAGFVTQYVLRVDKSGASTKYSFLIGVCEHHLLDDLFKMEATTAQPT